LIFGARREPLVLPVIPEPPRLFAAEPGIGLPYIRIGKPIQEAKPIPDIASRFQDDEQSAWRQIAGVQQI